MRLLSSVLFFLIFAYSSCTKEKQVEVYEDLDELNVTEAKISGKWYLKSKTDSVYDIITQELDNSQTQSYSLFNNDNYIDFTSVYHILAKENPFEYPDAKKVFLSSKTICTSQYGEPTNINWYTMYWYINEANNELNIYDEKYKIKYIDDNKLILVFDADKFTNSTITSVFER
jgi:hypothetical protein